MSGLQCHGRLWREVHEPGAPELAPDVTTAMRLVRSRTVAEAAKACLGDGQRITGKSVEERAAETHARLGQHARVYDAELFCEPLSARTDVLEHTKNGVMLTKVKASTKQKPEHVPDIAFQVHAAKTAGIDVQRASLMHLNRECRHPNLSNLFERVDLTDEILPEIARVALETARQLAMLDGPIPERSTGVDCDSPYPCPFQERCNMQTPDDHIGTAYRLGGKKYAQLVQMGCERLGDIPSTFKLGEIGARQRRAALAGGFIVEDSLEAALAELEPPIAFLDFETVAPAIPCWPGCRPYDAIPVQLSCHVQTSRGLVARTWMAEGPKDPRRAAAAAVVDVCAGARTVVAYHASFEKTAIERLMEGAPEFEHALSDVLARLRDLEPVVRDHLYDVRFRGSFSIKSVLPVLVPGQGYDDLAIGGGEAASATLERLLLYPEMLTESQRETQREDLLRYCGRDTLGMFQLFERLRQLV